MVLCAGLPSFLFKHKEVCGHTQRKKWKSLKGRILLQIIRILEKVYRLHEVFRILANVFVPLNLFTFSLRVCELETLASFPSLRIYSGFSCLYEVVTFESRPKGAQISQRYGPAYSDTSSTPLKTLGDFRREGVLVHWSYRETRSWRDNCFRCFHYCPSRSRCKGHNPFYWPLSAMLWINPRQQLWVTDCGTQSIVFCFLS